MHLDCVSVVDSFRLHIAVLLLSVIHYPQPCGAVFTVKILSQIATAAPIHLMSSFKEQLKALLQQLRVFEVRELDIPQDLEHSLRINTVVWRLTCRAPYSLNAEIHTASMTRSLFSPPHPSFTLSLSLSRSRSAAFVTLCSAAACALSLPLYLSLHLSFSCPLSSVPFWTEEPVLSLTCACQC